jgi:hypothetical protein
MDFYDMSRANSTGLALTKDFEILPWGLAPPLL